MSADPAEATVTPPGSSAASGDLLSTRRRAEELGARLPGLLVEADRIAATVAPGVHGRRRTGQGESFWQFRNYQAGDDAAKIDWRQSARSRALFIREQENEAAESVWLWCDLSPSMRFASAKGRPSKLDRALLLTVGLASLLIRGGERVALLGSGERPRPGRHGLDMLMRGLPAALAAGSPLPPQVPLPHFARIVMVSDFLEPTRALGERIGQWVAGGARGCLLEVMDPAEETLPYAGRVLFEGLESEGRALIGNVSAMRSRYAQVLSAHREEIHQLAGRRGWRLARHRTDRSAESGLLTLVQLLAPKALR